MAVDHRRMKMLRKALFFLLGFSGLCLVIYFYLASLVWLPGDQTTRSNFQKHRTELAALVTQAEQDSTIYLDTRKTVYDDGTNGATAAKTAQLLKAVRAQSLARSNGVICIHIWGIGYAICHDSSEGYFYSPITQPTRATMIVSTLESAGLPKDSQGNIEDSFYLLPITNDWCAFREENG